MEPGQAVLAERALGGSLDAEEHPERGVRTRVAADLAAFSRKPGDKSGLLADRDHVGDRHADVLGRDIIAAETVDRTPERGEQLGRFGAVGIGEDHRLAAAQGQAGHGVLVAHPARQAQRIGQRIGIVGIMPEPRAAGGRAEVGRVQRDDRAQAAGLVGNEMQRLMGVEIGVAPRGDHESFRPPDAPEKIARIVEKWGDRRGLNPRPSVPQTDALTN